MNHPLVSRLLGSLLLPGLGMMACASLLGCAQVHAPASEPIAGHGEARPERSASAPYAFAASQEVSGPGAAALGDDGADDDDDDDDDQDAEDHIHDDVPDTLDFAACLDRGPNSPPDCPLFSVKSPLDGLSSSEVGKRIKNDLVSVGSISLGPANAGRLFNGVRLPDSEHYKLTDPGNAYGTQESVDSIVRAVEKVFKKFPDSHKIIVGHLSAKGGGKLRPHKSHQSGRDVDLSYFYKDQKTWYTLANEQNLDKARTWAFIRAFIEDPNVEMILVDTSIQKILRQYAKDQGEDDAFLERVFQFGGKANRPILRHVAGHDTHIHVRFFSPNAQKTGQLAAAFLPKPPPPPKREGKRGKQTASSAKAGNGKQGDADDFILHRARSGDTLDSLARRYGVTVGAIKAANGLKSNAIKQKQTYRIPRTANNSGGAKRSRK